MYTIATLTHAAEMTRCLLITAAAQRRCRSERDGHALTWRKARLD